MTNNEMLCFGLGLITGMTIVLILVMLATPGYLL